MRCVFCSLKHETLSPAETVKLIVALDQSITDQPIHTSHLQSIFSHILSPTSIVIVYIKARVCTFVMMPDHQPVHLPPRGSGRGFLIHANDRKGLFEGGTFFLEFSYTAEERRKDKVLLRAISVSDHVSSEVDCI